MLIGAVPIGQLDISFVSVRSDKGLLRICVTADRKNFPNCADDGAAMKRSVPASTKSLRVDGLAHGGYAVAVIHDENENAKLDTFAGIPREGFGFSRNPAIRFGPPRFDAARFMIGGEPATQEIKLRYIL